jgi:hypothetical protein
MLSVFLVSDSAQKWFGKGKNVQPGFYHSSTGNPFEVQFRTAGWGIGEMRWDFGDGTQSEEQEPVHTFPGFGIYTIRQKISNACYADSIRGQILVQVTGIQDLSQDETLDFFPNPVDKKEGIIRFKNVPEEVYLMDLRGSRIALKPENEVFHLPQNLPSGAYQLHFKRERKTAISKKLLLIY